MAVTRRTLPRPRDEGSLRLAGLQEGIEEGQSGGSLAVWSMAEDTGQLTLQEHRDGICAEGWGERKD